MLCILNEDNLYLFSYDSSHCLCTEDEREDDQCLEYFQEYCPSLFYFQTESNLVYPFVKFVYNKTNINPYEWWEPTHICYSNQSCSNFILLMI